MLTAPAYKQALCPHDKAAIRLIDAGELYLKVTPNGSKRGFAKDRFAGKENRLALDNYSAVKVKAARGGR